ncbi:2-amino-4,5-dihydroxy-6-one-heptanoic acid-7-phosphate synthase [Streptomyces paludis]|uniref:2-amino-4,5-dihydroxy-6-one-heptanoic acid-7-phosphate synthase n=2 Tax=Streptomyces paludis TaxID=2282738 RepID=A0A345I1D6_9ACTN|nr:2-amino-3,7-dideoxy-D-threo-hept-6-ulosonate synthase [Streptomyces paludis]AXG82760.1 2-amino-4,5-dihydroxy-6-one-heptanoic acid-7-phosphate synthase [Streptomyces paludis]
MSKPLHGGSTARRIRLNRLFRKNPQRTVIVPLDHSLTDGPIPGGGSGLNTLVGRLAVNGADAVVLHKGNIRFVDPAWFKQLSLVVHLSASTVHAPDPDGKVLVGTVEEALRLGADAVSVHVNVGSREEARQIADLAAVTDACDRWNVPVLAMMYPRGPQVADPTDPALVAHAVTLAVELGVDIVKTYFVGSADSMREITAASPVPVVAAGGPRAGDQNALMDFVDAVLLGGAAGVAMGRNIFESPDPGLLTRRLAERVHGGLLPPAPAEFRTGLQLGPTAFSAISPDGHAGKQKGHRREAHLG